MPKLTTAQGSDLAGGDYLTVKGIYHFVLDDVLVGLSTKQKGISGNTLCLTCLDGNVPDCKDKKLNAVMWEPDPGKSAGSQQMSIKQITAFFLAANLIQPSQLGEDIDTDDAKNAIGEQFVMELAYNQKEVDGKYVDDPGEGLRIHYANIYHVDDTKVKDVPKNATALELIPGEKRHKPEWFSFRDSEKAAAQQKHESEGRPKFDPSKL